MGLWLAFESQPASWTGAQTGPMAALHWGAQLAGAVEKDPEDQLHSPPRFSPSGLLTGFLHDQIELEAKVRQRSPLLQPQVERKREQREELARHMGRSFTQMPMASCSVRSNEGILKTTRLLVTLTI